MLNSQLGDGLTAGKCERNGILEEGKVEENICGNLTCVRERDRAMFAGSRDLSSAGGLIRQLFLVQYIREYFPKIYLE